MRAKWTILALAILGTVPSTLLVAAALDALAAVFVLGIPPAWCLVFGALISPTDPVALALALPASPSKDALLTMAYGIVVFSIVVQGLSLEWVARRSLARGLAAAVTEPD